MDQVTVRVYGDLRELARDLDRDGTVMVPVGAPRSVKDLVESLGIPHTDVGALVVGERAVGFDYRVAGGERVAVYPPFHDLPLPEPLRPEPPPRRFVLDVHLGTLARHLRLLGFDSWYRTDADDPLLADVAVEEDRVLLTRDRGLLMRSQIVYGHTLRSQDPLAQTVEVCRRFALGAHLDPFTRCLACNGVLRSAGHAEVAAGVPPRAREAHDRFVRCRACGRLYWPGTHTDRLRQVIDEVAGALGVAPPEAPWMA